MSWPGSFREGRLEATAGYELASACIEMPPLCQSLVCVSLSEDRAGGGQKGLLLRKQIKREKASGDGPCCLLPHPASLPLLLSVPQCLWLPPTVGLLSPPVHWLPHLLLPGRPVRDLVAAGGKGRPLQFWSSLS